MGQRNPSRSKRFIFPGKADAKPVRNAGHQLESLCKMSIAENRRSPGKEAPRSSLLQSEFLELKDRLSSG